MLILPAIDLIQGKCVRLTQGDYARETVYSDDPVTMAKKFEALGATWLHLVDLDGARTGIQTNLHILKQITEKTTLKVEIGGGIRGLDSAKKALDYGASRVIVGTKLVQEPDLAAQLFEELGEKVVAGLDAKNGLVAISGWTETSGLTIIEGARRVVQQGCQRIIVTDISKDGMMAGPNLSLLHSVIQSVGIPIIQSGGISNLADVASLCADKNLEPEGVIVGKALYESDFDLRRAIEMVQVRVSADKLFV